MKQSPYLRLFLAAILFLLSIPAVLACDPYSAGFFQQVTALKGEIVGLKAGPLQRLRTVRQAFHRKKVRLILYQYGGPGMRGQTEIVKIVHADEDGKFDFGPLPWGHYTLEVDDHEWDTESWFDIEVVPMLHETDSVMIDISPALSNCKAGQEVTVNRHQ